MINHRYEIQKYIAGHGNTHLYFACDTVSEGQVMFTLVLFGSSLSPREREGLHAYYQSVVAWSRQTPLHGFPVVDFGEIAPSPDFPNHESLSSFRDAYFFVSEKPKDFVMLQEVSRESLLQAQAPVLAALSWAHEKGAILAHLSPHSIFVRADFSQACFLNVGMVPPGYAHFFRSDYSAPEVIAHAPYDTRSDLYAVAAIFYHLSTGQLPGNTPEKHKEEKLEAIVPGRMASALLKAMQWTPAKRFSDASQWAAHVFSTSVPGIFPRHYIFRDFLRPSLGLEIEDFLNEKGSEKIAFFVQSDYGEGTGIFLEETRDRLRRQGMTVFFARLDPGLSFLFHFSEWCQASWEETVSQDPSGLFFGLEENGLRTREQIARKVFDMPGTVLLLIDNLQWMDQESFDLLKHLMVAAVLEQGQSKNQGKSVPCRISIIGSGVCPAQQEHPYAQFLQSLQSSSLLKEKSTIRRWEKGDDSLTSHLVASALGVQKAPERFCASLGQATRNNPLHISETLTVFLKTRSLYRDENQDWCVEAESLEKIKFPQDIAEAMGWHLAALSPMATEVLDLLSESKSGWSRLASYFRNDGLCEVLWQIYRDRMIDIDPSFEISLRNASLSQFFVSWEGERKMAGETDRLVEDASFLGLVSATPFYARSGEAGRLFAGLWKIIPRFFLLGMNSSLERILERHSAMIETQEGGPEFLLDLAIPLKRYDRAAFYAQKISIKKASSNTLCRMAQLALHEKEFETSGALLKQLETRLDESPFLLRFLRSQERYLQHRIEEAVYELEKAFEAFLDLAERPEWPFFDEEIIPWFLLVEYSKKGEEILLRLLENAEKRPFSPEKIRLHHFLGLFQQHRGQYEKSLGNFQKSLQWAQELGYPLSETRALLSIAELYVQAGCYKKATMAIQSASLACKKYELRSFKARISSIKAKLLFRKNKIEEACGLYQESVVRYRKSGPMEETAMALSDLSLAMGTKKISKALQYWEEADRIAGRFSCPRIRVSLALARSELDEMQEQEEGASLPIVDEALKSAIEYGYRDYVWRLHRQKGICYRSLGNMTRAIEQFRQACEVVAQIAGTLSGEIKECFLGQKEVKAVYELVDSLTVEIPVGSGWKDEIHRALEESPSDVALDVVKEYQKEVDTMHLKSLREEVSSLHKLLEINKNINMEHDLHKLLSLIMDTAIEITRAERGFLILNSDDRKAFEVARNFEKEAISNPQFEVSHSITEKVIRTGIPILSTDATQDERFEGYQSVSELRLHSVLALPLRIKEKIIGAVYIDNRFEKGVFSEKEKGLLEAFADQASIAIENTRLLNENLEKQEKLKESHRQIEKLNQELAQANAKLSQKVESREQEIKEIKYILNQSQSSLEHRYQYHNIVGKSASMQEVFKVLDKVSDKNIPVLIYGESGTGKELVARAIHFNGWRKEKNFLSENCATISDTLLASELFGHVKGAFTGAYANKKGLFELADGGTLFLDEVGDMSPSMQANLLRVLESGVIRKVGGKDETSVDVRIISASNKNLHDMVTKGSFREDLFFRLKVVQIDLPPLRERKEDIPCLVDYFLNEYAVENKSAPRRIDKKALHFLMSYHWPGNIRELRNTLYNVLSLNEEEELTSSHFNNLASGGTQKNADFFNQEMSIDEYARLFVLKNQEKYNDSQLARILGFSRKTLWEKRKKWGLMRN